MKMLWCWRCRMEVPMLDDNEYMKAGELYSQCLRDRTSFPSMEERFKPLFDYYEELTGWKETVANAIMHHQISQYGSLCEKCGKPYRTKKATFCAACGNRRSGAEISIE